MEREAEHVCVEADRGSPAYRQGYRTEDGTGVRHAGRHVHAMRRARGRGHDRTRVRLLGPNATKMAFCVHLRWKWCKKCTGPATATGRTAYPASLGHPSGGAASPTARDTHPLILSQDLSICQSNGTGLFLHPTSIDPFAARDHACGVRARGKSCDNLPRSTHRLGVRVMPPRR
jgi:hypothetical protein